MPNTISLSEELLDMMVDAITKLPYREAQPIFERLGQELAPTPEQPEPQIILN